MLPTVGTLPSCRAMGSQRGMVAGTQVSNDQVGQDPASGSIYGEAILSAQGCLQYWDWGGPGPGQGSWIIKLEAHLMWYPGFVFITHTSWQGQGEQVGGGSTSVLSPSKYSWPIYTGFQLKWLLQIIPPKIKEANWFHCQAHFLHFALDCYGINFLQFLDSFSPSLSGT